MSLLRWLKPFNHIRSFSSGCSTDRYLSVQVVICSACSGHGYKFCSVIGEILADIATDGDTRHDIAMHRIAPNRLGFATFQDAFIKSRM